MIMLTGSVQASACDEVYKGVVFGHVSTISCFEMII